MNSYGEFTMKLVLTWKISEAENWGGILIKKLRLPYTFDSQWTQIYRIWSLSKNAPKDYLSQFIPEINFFQVGHIGPWKGRTQKNGLGVFVPFFLDLNYPIYFFLKKNAQNNLFWTFK